MLERLAAPLLALLLLTASAPGATAQAMTREEFEQLLDRMRSKAREAVDHYENGDTQAALEDAKAVREKFTFDEDGASEVEQRIRQISALAVADRSKALANRLVSAIQAGDPVEDVQAIADELVPSLNRLVLINKGEHAPASKRKLKTDEAIDAAAEEVMAQVDKAVELYADGEAEAAEQTANEAFFTFETNGLGPDVAIVDEPLENRVENQIKNFDKNQTNATALADLIARGAPIDQVRDQAETIEQGIDEIVELLKATKPPASLGDANSDGQVTIVDALWIAQAALGLRSDEATMDANQDGSVTIVDALVTAQAALGVRSL